MNARSFRRPSRRRFGRRSGHVALALTATGLSAAGNSFWGPVGGGDWHSATNWNGVIPNADGAAAFIGATLQSAATITLGSPTRVGRLVMTGTHDISVVGTLANRLTFAESPLTSEALLEALGSGNRSVSHLGLESNLRVDVGGTASVGLSGSLTGTERTIRKTGAGLLVAPSSLEMASSLVRSEWNIQGGTVRFNGTLGGTGTNSNRLRLDGGTVQFTGAGALALQGGWSIGAGGGSVDVGAGRSIQVTGPVSGNGTFTKIGEGALGFSSTGGSSFSGNVRFLAGVLFGSAAQPYIIRGGYEDLNAATLFIYGQSTSTNLVRTLTFENGRSNVITAGIRLAANARGGIGASGPDTVLEVASLIQSADLSNQNLYLSTRDGAQLILGANARIDSTLANGNGRTSAYWDDGTGELRLAPGFVADYAPLDPATGWSGLDVYGGTMVSTESQNLPDFLRFNAPRAGAENVWRTENADQVYGQAARLNASTRITTITGLALTGTAMAAGAILTKDGPGTLVLDPNPTLNDFGLGTGILVEEGTVQIGYQVASAANLAVDVRPGARLTGDGRMGALAVSGTVAPGRPGQDFASLTAVGIVMGEQAAYEVDLGTDPVTDVDRLIVEGATTILDGRLNLTLLAEPTPFVQYVIVDNRFGLPVLGTFDQGSSVSADFGGVTYPFEILYGGGDGNDVTLMTLVPEPGAGSLVLLGAGVGLLGRRAARRR
ncbi:MAG: hypothetical protein ACKVYV_04305 [Limisphaerales bacterium]